jgi:DNA mismatch repair protein MutS
MEQIFNPDNSIYTEYFRLTDHFSKKYGQNTVLLLQVGAFFEIYGTKEQDGSITRSKIEEACLICGGLSIAEKKYTHGTSQVVMAGFRDYNIDRYIQSLVDSNITVVVYTQKDQEKDRTGKMTRELNCIYSPGTFLPADVDTVAKMTNNICCVWIDKFVPLARTREQIVCGASVVNIFTGESAIFEYENSLEMVPATFDALERFISTHAPSETIIVHSFADADAKRVAQYSGIQSRIVHYVAQEDGATEVDRCRQPKYVRQLLSAFFQEDTYDICEEFRTYQIATQSYIYLLNFIQERNPNLVRKIMLPAFDNRTTNMVLANHTLRQLNIIDDRGTDAVGNLKSVVAFLNKCCSAGGRRKFYNQLVHPTFDETWLNAEYDAISQLIGLDIVDVLRKYIREIADLEKIARQLVSRKLNPDSIHRLYKSVLSIRNIHLCAIDHRELCAYFAGADADDVNAVISGWIQHLLELISSNLIVEKCEGSSSATSFECNIVRPGVSAELDSLLGRLEENDALFQEIRKTFNGIMSKIDSSKSGGSAQDYVRVHETEKSGAFLHLTKKRSMTLKKHLAELLKRDAESKIGISVGKKTVAILASEIQMTSAGTTNDALEFPMLDRIIREKQTIKETINTTIASAYAEFLDKLEQSGLHIIEKLANFVSRVDVLQSKCFVANTYGYCRPVIDVSDAESSYFRAEGLRHCLIEHIQKQELYVANDVALSCDDMNSTGILLYGTNAVGKTSLIRAVGIAIIMAQSGMYVPCTKFNYRPYRSIFTRILGNDNLFKNLSMFAVEMSELRVILNSADKNSLVLGDELCSGTETESALSIFASGLTDLHKKSATFLFATHFHEVLKFEEIRSLKRVAVKHMAVRYDMEKDALIYDRLLRDGPGNRLYGLEVAKSLHLPDEFIERAYSIRNRYFPEMRGELSAPEARRYNSQKIKSLCELCKEEIAVEVHHLQEQKLADKQGRIGTIHKNHPANLMNLCEKCHKAQHISSASASQKPKIVRKKTTKGFIVEPVH